jgi:peptidoglycan/LPS O-acetylase OafA/YrhL
MKQRNFALDALRGLAILLVLIRHIPGEPVSGPVRVLFELGWTGVDLFFVLSGYLISRLLYQELDATGTIKLSRFWLRRGLKIWPSYFACFGTMVITAAAFELLTGQRSAAAKRLLASLPNLIFIQNYTGYWWPHSWSLAIEEHFYLLLPLLLILLGRKSLRQKLPLVLFLICCGVLMLRVATYLAGWVEWQSFYYPTHLRLDALAFGVFLGYVHHYQADRFNSIARRWPLLLAAVPLIGIAVLFPLERSVLAVTVGFTVLYLAYGALVIIAAAYPETGKNLGPVRVLAWCGVYSYTIYLAHSAISLIPAFSSDSTAEKLWPTRFLFWSLSIGGGILLSHTVERPFLRWRQRVQPSARSYTTLRQPEANGRIGAPDLLCDPATASGSDD